MKAGFIPGAKVRSKGAGENLGVLAVEEAEIVRYDLEGFYIVRTARSTALVVHEDDVELVPKEEPCSACGGSGDGPDRIDGPGDVYQAKCERCDGAGRIV